MADDAPGYCLCTYTAHGVTNDTIAGQAGSRLYVVDN